MNSYRAADGRWFYLIGLEAVRHFPGLARAIGREELIEVLMQTACYAGVPAAVAALNAGADVLK